MLIQRESPDQVAAIRTVVAAAFADPAAPGATPVEAPLVDQLRAGDAWLPELSLVAVHPTAGVVGHVLCTRGRLGGAPVLGLAPLAVHPDHQRRGVGLALVHAVLGAADALGEPLVALLGSPAYYSRYGFVLAEEYGIDPPVPDWRPHFQVRTLTTFTPSLRGTFRYAEPFGRL